MKLVVTDDQVERVCYRGMYPWTRTELQFAVDQYQGRVSLRNIGKKLGICYQAVRRALDLLGVGIRKSGPKPKLHGEKKERAIRLLGMKFTQMQVAKEVGVGRSTICELAKEIRDGTAV